jgi:hypothetical protein
VSLSATDFSAKNHRKVLELMGPGLAQASFFSPGLMVMAEFKYKYTITSRDNQLAEYFFHSIFVVADVFCIYGRPFLKILV